VAERSLTGRRVLVAGGALGGLGGVVSNAGSASKGRMVEALAACLIPADVAKVVAFLSAVRAGYVNDQWIAIDGGAF
jgi:hypothetical protein